LPSYFNISKQMHGELHPMEKLSKIGEIYVMLSFVVFKLRNLNLSRLIYDVNL
jgi:hypothetical protein